MKINLKSLFFILNYNHFRKGIFNNQQAHLTIHIVYCNYSKNLECYDLNSKLEYSLNQKEMIPPKEKIKHIIVVMFENRSFDHMLGFLYKNNKSPLGHPFEGLTGQETNPDGKGDTIQVFPIKNDNPYTYYMPKMDPGEGFMNTNFQLFGNLNPPYPSGIAPNHGFVRDFENKIGNKYFGDPPFHPKKPTNKTKTTPEAPHKVSDHYKDENYHHWYKHVSPPQSGLEIVSKFPNTEPKDIMGMYTPETLPVLSNLAKSYAVCDHYYCSVPSETLPNRAFMHMATSQGHLYDETQSYSARSIFKHLESNNHTWGIYGDGSKYSYTYSFCQDIYKKDGSVPKGCGYGEFKAFQDALDNENLPDYVFIEPEWGSYGNSQHPNYDVAAGEAYMLKIYNALKNSKYWEDTLLIINYDEHGGCYDHVTPPTGATQPNPEAINKATGFKFDRFGVRVPCVLISPWIEAGTVYRTKSETPLDHTSILKTIEELFNLLPLTNRDKAAPSILDVLSLSEVRKDDPMKGIKAPVADASVKIPNHASQIIKAHAASLTEHKNRETGENFKTPDFKTDEEAKDYIRKSYEAYN